MSSYTHIPLLVLCFFILLFMRRWWMCIGKLGFTKEVGRRAPSLVYGDIIAAAFLLLPFVIAGVDWFDITLPYQSSQLSSGVAALMSLVSICACYFTLGEFGNRFGGTWSGNRFAGSWPRSLESALRTVAALGVINETELADALQTVRQLEESHWV